MKVKIFHIPEFSPESAISDFNRFLAANQVAEVQKHFVPDGPNSFWSVWVSVTQHQESRFKPGKAKVDYKKVRECMDQVREFVKDRLSLRVKEQVTQINSSHQGITFCGYRVFLGRIGLTRRKKKRYRMMKEKWETLFKAGLIDGYRQQQGFTSVQGAVALADAGGWIRILPVSKVEA